ncbi:hypothetical protein GWI33_005871 [Rhynchophorus ferrugineus]|uniref:Uncharacterized protein n=1 Tax=Rhynchophorus ferrugineus TaxID=354439 RepID=A0A834IM77_RHYFE|nr:hypothetical protein GWI33_005871 [Rhynchophorus ferrugineus]
MNKRRTALTDLFKVNYRTACERRKRMRAMRFERSQQKESGRPLIRLLYGDNLDRYYPGTVARLRPLSVKRKGQEDNERKNLRRPRLRNLECRRRETLESSYNKGTEKKPFSMSDLTVTVKALLATEDMSRPSPSRKKNKDCIILFSIRERVSNNLELVKNKGEK